ncbi:MULTISPECIES: hypothetical protein [Burkholderia]|uniref:hypothetical protein n=1 Tax=Burkholderia TaxID=32008 RepID=UPI00163E02F9|nr:MULTISPECIES: hypothetical protein [Burkholderia]MCQ0032560.1 hypothetical protein [Burkholderia glumae]MCQ0035802.1 hypothetical protein [Burkholderia glumae]MDR8087808.1 hypothetical protein [Burkholderia gladioli]
MGIKLKASYETEIYISQGGYLVIHQVNGLGEESQVLLSPEQAQAVVSELSMQLKDTSWWESASSNDDQD